MIKSIFNEIGMFWKNVDPRSRLTFSSAGVGSSFGLLLIGIFDVHIIIFPAIFSMVCFIPSLVVAYVELGEENETENN
jgi:hypothetical protein